MTRDNLRKRHIIQPLDCVFCSEQETNTHLFFECIVAKNIWLFAADHFQVRIGIGYESVARFWVSNKKNSALNIVSLAVLWCLWKYRNSIIFNNTIWTSISQVWRLILRTLKFWAILAPEKWQGTSRELHDSASYVLPAAAEDNELLMLKSYAGDGVVHQWDMLKI